MKIDFSIIENNFLSEIKLDRRWDEMKFVNRMMFIFMLFVLFSFGCSYAQPLWTNNQTSISSPANYTAGITYGFQINWTDNVTVIANATFQLGRANGSYSNYTIATTPAVTNTSATWQFNITQVQFGGAGTYNYTWIGTNGTGVQNTSTTLVYVISTGTNPVYLYLNDTSNNNTYQYPQSVNATASALAGVQLYRNDTTVSGANEQILLGSAVYMYTANATVTQNYSANSTGLTFYATVNPGTPTLSVASLASVTYPTATQTGCQLLTGDTGANITLYRNNTQVNTSTTLTTINETSITLGAAKYNYTCTYNGTQNYTYTSSPNNYRTVNQTTPTLSVASLASVTYPTATQTGCQLLTGDTGANITLYRNNTQVNTSTTLTTINETSITLGAAKYNYTCTYNGTQNYTYTSSPNNYRTVSQGTPTSLLSISGSNVTYPYWVTIVPSVTNAAGDADINYTLYRNTTLFSSSIGSAPSGDQYENLEVGVYIYKFNASAGKNWTANSTGINITVNVTKGTLSELSFSDSNVTYPDNISLTTSDADMGTSDVNYTLYMNGNLVNSTYNGTLPSYNKQQQVGSYLFILNTTNETFKNWTASSTGVSSTIIVSSTPTTTTISSGGGGGGGTPPPMQKKKIQSWDKITPGSAEIMHVDDPEIGLKMITVTVRNPVKTVSITVTKLDGKPASVVHDVSGTVYKYIDISPTNIPDNSIDKVDIQFQVNKSWISNNNINRATITLNRYVNDGWQKLVTKGVSEDKDYIYFEAETPGFSIYAVTGEQMVTQTSIVTSIPTSTVETTIPTTIPTTNETGRTSWIPIMIGFLALIVIATFFLYGNKKLKHRKSKAHEQDIREKFTLPGFQ